MAMALLSTQIARCDQKKIATPNDSIKILSVHVQGESNYKNLKSSGAATAFDAVPLPHLQIANSKKPLHPDGMKRL
jgi:hypothetical protein